MLNAMRMMAAATILAVQLAGEPVAHASCPAESGVLSGGNTEDNWGFAGNFSAGTYTIGTQARGSGTNKLTIRVQKHGGLGWSTIASDTIDLGAVGTCGDNSFQFTLASSEDIRIQFTRKVGTSQIDYDWDVDFTVVWGGLQSRCLSC